MSDESQHVEEAPREYWLRARRPLASIMFLVPLLLIYECGIYLLGERDPESLRNGADYWMRGFLSAVGFSNALLLPIILLFVLFAWHVLSGDPWKVRGATVMGMSAESLLFACCLVALGQMHNAMFDALPEVKELSVTTPPASVRVISFIGAGVYEEVLFRLCLVPAAYGFFRLFECSQKTSAVCAVLATSVVFAVAHYVGPAADTFTMFTFSFRALAGVFFAALFLVRGFGITVGAHAAYDLLVGVLFASSQS